MTAKEELIQLRRDKQLLQEHLAHQDEVIAKIQQHLTQRNKLIAKMQQLTMLSEQVQTLQAQLKKELRT